jgi:hypothetical protein
VDESGLDDEAKSVHRQIELARVLAQECGWTIDEEHIYTDEESGAEFDKRPGLIRLLNHLKPKRSATGDRRSFEALIVTDRDRLGREMFEASFNCKQIDHRKNDQAWVEHRNGLLVRRLIGCDRYTSRAAQPVLQRLYDALRLQHNFFRPVHKLLSKRRVGRQPGPQTLRRRPGPESRLYVLPRLGAGRAAARQAPATVRR